MTTTLNTPCSENTMVLSEGEDFCMHVFSSFMGENLTPVTEVKDLGMLLDSHLTYEKHIQSLSSSCI
jgi:hypothetical protein